MQQHLHFSIFTLVALLLTCQPTIASPSIKLCLNKNCKNPIYTNISYTCWTRINTLFSPTASTDIQEQKTIVKAIAMLKFDTYHSLVKKVSITDNAEDLYANSSNKNVYKNLKSYLGLLLDNYLIKRHVLRKSIMQNSWSPFGTDGLLLQSVTDSRLYILESNTSQLLATPSIKGYNRPSETNMEEHFEQNSDTLNNADFE